MTDNQTRTIQRLISDYDRDNLQGRSAEDLLDCIEELCNELTDIIALSAQNGNYPNSIGPSKPLSIGMTLENATVSTIFRDQEK